MVELEPSLLYDGYMLIARKVMFFFFHSFLFPLFLRINYNIFRVHKDDIYFHFAAFRRTEWKNMENMF